MLAHRNAQKRDRYSGSISEGHTHSGILEDHPFLAADEEELLHVPLKSASLDVKLQPTHVRVCPLDHSHPDKYDAPMKYTQYSGLKVQTSPIQHKTFSL